MDIRSDKENMNGNEIDSINSLFSQKTSESQSSSLLILTDTIRGMFERLSETITDSALRVESSIFQIVDRLKNKNEILSDKSGSWRNSASSVSNKEVILDLSERQGQEREIGEEYNKIDARLDLVEKRLDSLAPSDEDNEDVQIKNLNRSEGRIDSPNKENTDRIENNTEDKDRKREEYPVEGRGLIQDIQFLSSLISRRKKNKEGETEGGISNTPVSTPDIQQTDQRDSTSPDLITRESRSIQSSQEENSTSSNTPVRQSENVDTTQSRIQDTQNRVQNVSLGQSEQDKRKSDISNSLELLRQRKDSISNTERNEYLGRISKDMSSLLLLEKGRDLLLKKLLKSAEDIAENQKKEQEESNSKEDGNSSPSFPDIDRNKSKGRKQERKSGKTEGKGQSGGSQNKGQRVNSSKLGRVNNAKKASSFLKGARGIAAGGLGMAGGLLGGYVLDKTLEWAFRRDNMTDEEIDEDLKKEVNLQEKTYGKAESPDEYRMKNEYNRKVESGEIQRSPESFAEFKKNWNKKSESDDKTNKSESKLEESKKSTSTIVESVLVQGKKEDQKTQSEAGIQPVTNIPTDTSTSSLPSSSVVIPSLPSTSQTKPDTQIREVIPQVREQVQVSRSNQQNTPQVSQTPEFNQAGKNNQNTNQQGIPQVSQLNQQEIKQVPSSVIPVYETGRNRSQEQNPTVQEYSSGRRVSELPVSDQSKSGDITRNIPTQKREDTERQESARVSTARREGNEFPVSHSSQAALTLPEGRETRQETSIPFNTQTKFEQVSYSSQREEKESGNTPENKQTQKTEQTSENNNNSSENVEIVLSEGGITEQEDRKSSTSSFPVSETGKESKKSSGSQNFSSKEVSAKGVEVNGDVYIDGDITVLQDDKSRIIEGEIREEKKDSQTTPEKNNERVLFDPFRIPQTTKERTLKEERKPDSEEQVRETVQKKEYSTTEKAKESGGKPVSEVRKEERNESEYRQKESPRERESERTNRENEQVGSTRQIKDTAETRTNNFTKPIVLVTEKTPSENIEIIETQGRNEIKDTERVSERDSSSRIETQEKESSSIREKLERILEKDSSIIPLQQKKEELSPSQIAVKSDRESGIIVVNKEPDIHEIPKEEQKAEIPIQGDIQRSVHRDVERILERESKSKKEQQENIRDTLLRVYSPQFNQNVYPSNYTSSQNPFPLVKFREDYDEESPERKQKVRQETGVDNRQDIFIPGVNKSPVIPSVPITSSEGVSENKNNNRKIGLKDFLLSPIQTAIPLGSGIFSTIKEGIKSPISSVAKVVDTLKKTPESLPPVLKNVISTVSNPLSFLSTVLTRNSYTSSGNKEPLIPQNSSSSQSGQINTNSSLPQIQERESNSVPPLVNTSTSPLIRSELAKQDLSGNQSYKINPIQESQTNSQEEYLQDNSENKSSRLIDSESISPITSSLIKEASDNLSRMKENDPSKYAEFVKNNNGIDEHFLRTLINISRKQLYSIENIENIIRSLVSNQRMEKLEESETLSFDELSNTSNNNSNNTSTGMSGSSFSPSSNGVPMGNSQPMMQSGTGEAGMNIPQGSGSEMTGGKSVQGYLSIMQKNAQGSTYSQANRMKDKVYDCSSFVSRSLQEAGFDIAPNNTTSSLPSALSKIGFTFTSLPIPSGLTRAPSQLQAGDILLNPGKHVETYMGNNMMVGAHSTSSGVSVKNFYSTGYPGFWRLGGSGASSSQSQGSIQPTSTNPFQQSGASSQGQLPSSPLIVPNSSPMPSSGGFGPSSNNSSSAPMTSIPMQQQTSTGMGGPSFSPFSNGVPGRTGGGVAPEFGSLLSKYETSGKGTTKISNTEGDSGGASYGKFQLSYNKGSLKEFLGMLQKTNPQAYSQLAPLWNSASQGAKGAFGQKWLQLANAGQLQATEEMYARKTYMEGSMAKLKDRGLIQRINSNSALQEVYLSTAVQHGATGAANIWNEVANSNMSDEDIIRAVYAERGRTDGNGKLVHFKGKNSLKMQAGVARRFREEVQDALRMNQQVKSGTYNGQLNQSQTMIDPNVGRFSQQNQNMPQGGFNPGFPDGGNTPMAMGGTSSPSSGGSGFGVNNVPSFINDITLMAFQAQLMEG